MSAKKTLCTNCISGKNSIFKALSNEDKQLLQDAHSCRSYKRGEIIYRKGDSPSGLLCLSAGKVKVLKQGIGRGQIIRLSKPVGFIGYRALFAGELYTSSAVAIEDSTICIINKKALFDVLNRNGKFGLNMLNAMAHELGISHKRTVNLTQKHTRARLAESLIFLVDTFGYEDDNETISVCLSRNDLASLSSMTTSNAIRTLSSFADEELIALEGKKIRILDLKKIKRIDDLG